MKRSAALKRTPVRKKRRGPPRRGPARDEKYLEFIRSRPCAVCIIYFKSVGPDHKECVVTSDQKSPTEAAHTGSRGMSQKASDLEAIPLCGLDHHREGPYSHHKLGKKFFEHHQIDREQLITTLNKLYQEETCHS